MRKIAIALQIVILLATISAAVDLGARPMGMAGAFVGLADDSNAVFVNPAGLGGIKSESAIVTTRLITGAEYSMVSGVEQTPFGNIGVGYIGSTDPVKEGLMMAGIEDGETATKYTNQSLYLSYARNLADAMRVSDALGELMVGVNVKFSSKKAGMANGLIRDMGSKVDIDVSSIFKVNPSLQFGVTMQNLVNNFSSPTAGNQDLLLGAAGKFFASDLTWSIQGSSIGCEWKPIKQLAFRAGHEKEGYTAGAGFSIGAIAIDYAYLQKDSPVQYFSVAINPDKGSNDDIANRPRAAFSME